MTARTRPQLDRHPSPHPVEQITWADVPTRLKAALVTAAAAALLSAAAPVVGILTPPPGFSATPLLVLLALLPAAAAVAFTAARKPVTAAAVLTAAALLAPGRALVDLQLAVDALRAARPEIFVPTSLAPLQPQPGLWLLIAGHVLAAAAGVLAAARAGAEPGSPYAAELDDPDRTTRARAVFTRVALLAGTATAVGLLLVPFTSDDAFVLALGMVDAPAPARFGLLALAVGAAGAAVVAGNAASLPVARGMAVGLLAAVAGVTVPQIAAGLLVDRLHPASGPYLALAAAAALAAAIWTVDPAASAKDADVRLDLRALHRVAGGLGVLTAAAALLAGTSDLIVAHGIDTPPAYASRLFVPVAIAVLLLSLPMFAPGPAAATRPAFIVVLAGVALAGAGSLDAAFTATGASGAVAIGPGVWFAGAALLLGCAAATTAAIAGGAERDDVDLTERGYHLPLAAPAAVGALLAVGAFGLPVLTAPDLVAPGIWTQFRFASWGLLIALLAVLAAAALAPAARPPRAAALLLGAAALVGVRALEYPLTAARAADGRPGQGLWLALAATLALVVAAAAAVGGRR
ncbi:hypothetical protein [Actinokineospora sp. NPDC004072]